MASFEVEDVKPITPHTEAILNAGSRLLSESIETGREFCKSMISFSIAAIPAYIGLLKLFIPKDTLISSIVSPIWLLPILLFILSASIFVFGYLPVRKLVSLELPDAIENAIEKQINRRFWLGVIGFVLLCVGIASGVGVIACL
ncbi:hypothetical protein FHG08_11800 [Pseudoalteromonas sp. Scap03]|uniref:hypothetical protein n=1 Tax=unclassified Pseudoalteromonas TaxID=194690 RepID=UPI0015BE182A|nr:MULTISPECIES: hypothetical protein [unclassified Pseudoalteromonas]NWL16375.1 hypothetical protein [Pseudoalteromonas sp. Scap03]QLE81491.1 hypothetical protein FLM54_08055 [Pseudoalteromonas sp. Scap25]QLE89435.1 hypothetical protein FLM47_08050 [Pseudoalteromonas sp. Scap06]